MKPLQRDLEHISKLVHVDKGLTNKLFLTRKFFTTQMNLNDTMEQHLNKLGKKIECNWNTHFD